MERKKTLFLNLPPTAFFLIFFLFILFLNNKSFKRFSFRLAYIIQNLNLDWQKMHKFKKKDEDFRSSLQRLFFGLKKTTTFKKKERNIKKDKIIIMIIMIIAIRLQKLKERESS